MLELFREDEPYNKRLVSPREFAELIGVSRKAVNDAIHAERLGRSVTTLDGRHRIDVAVGVIEWFANADPTKDHDNRIFTKFAENSQEEAGSTQIPPYGESKRLREFFTAELLRLEHEERRGDLVPRSIREEELFELGRLLREKILVLPELLAPRLVNLDTAEVRNVLTAEFERTLEELSCAAP